MPRKIDGLRQALEQLERVAAENATGRERAWADEVDHALASLEQTLYQHSQEGETTAGVFGEVDLTRPGLVRQVGELRREHTDLLDEVHGLREGMQQAVRAFSPSADAANLATSLPDTAAATAVPDFGVLRQRTVELAATLRHHQEQETDLVQESVTTDLGAGD